VGEALSVVYGIVEERVKQRMVHTGKDIQSLLAPQLCISVPALIHRIIDDIVYVLGTHAILKMKGEEGLIPVDLTRYILLTEVAIRELMKQPERVTDDILFDAMKDESLESAIYQERKQGWPTFHRFISSHEAKAGLMRRVPAEGRCAWKVEDEAEADALWRNRESVMISEDVSTAFQILHTDTTGWNVVAYNDMQRVATMMGGFITPRTREQIAERIRDPSFCIIRGGGEVRNANTGQKEFIAPADIQVHLPKDLPPHPMMRKEDEEYPFTTPEGWQRGKSPYFLGAEDVSADLICNPFSVAAVEDLCCAFGWEHHGFASFARKEAERYIRDEVNPGRKNPIRWLLAEIFTIDSLIDTQPGRHGLSRYRHIDPLTNQDLGPMTNYNSRNVHRQFLPVWERLKDEPIFRRGKDKDPENPRYRLRIIWRAEAYPLDEEGMDLIRRVWNCD
jgi:hypothetical protein